MRFTYKAILDSLKQIQRDLATSCYSNANGGLKNLIAMLGSAKEWELDRCVETDEDRRECKCGRKK